MNKIRCAVIGVGYLGKFHSDKYAALDNAELVAVSDASPERCDEVAKLHNVEGVVDYTKLIGKVDAVSIAVPTSNHYEVAKLFLENGVHVLLEKPITTTVAEAEELIKIAKDKNVVFQIGHLERFNPALIAMQEVLDKPIFIESLRIAPFKIRATDVSVVLDLMIHDIDLVQHLVGSEIKDIRANGAPVLSKHLDIANARIEFENGCVANVSASRVSSKMKRQMRVFQHDAFFSGDLQNKTLSIHRKGKNEMFPGVPEIVRENLALADADALLEEIKAFLASIENGSAPLVSGEDGLRALHTAHRITDVVTENMEAAKELWPSVS